MIKIRKNVFETNSSSIHSICIPKDVSKVRYGHINFGTDEYGWSHYTYDFPDDTASYLLTAILEMYKYDEAMNAIKWIEDVLEKNNIKYHMPMYEKIDEYGYAKHYGYIDHCVGLAKFLEDVLNNEDLLLRYLYGGAVYTGNDNCDLEDYPACCKAEPVWVYNDDIKRYQKMPNPSWSDDMDYYFKGN